MCFFMSDFWWNRLPQYWQGYGRVSLWISKCVDNVLDRLKDLPHCLHWNGRNRRLVIIIIKNVTIDCMTQQFVFNKSLNQYHFLPVHLTGLDTPATFAHEPFSCPFVFITGRGCSLILLSSPWWRGGGTERNDRMDEIRWRL